MHKYQPKVLVFKLTAEQAQMNYEHLQRHLEEKMAANLYSDVIEEFIFPETAFITVTAYQNQQVSRFATKMFVCLPIRQCYYLEFSRQSLVCVKRVQIMC